MRFFHNHGMLSVDQRPQWRTIHGGSARYVEKLTAPFRDRIRLRYARSSGSGVCPDRCMVKARGTRGRTLRRSVPRLPQRSGAGAAGRRYAAGARVLGAIPYQENEAVLHTDTRLLPRRRRAWAAWNYHVCRRRVARVALTYNMNILQSLQSREPFLVTLNHSAAIDPAKIIKRIRYHHPLFTPRGRGGASAPGARSMARSTRTSAAPTGASAFMRTVW